MFRIARSSVDDQPKQSQGSVDDERPRPCGRIFDASELLDRCDDELAVVVDEYWTHRIVNPHALSPAVDANVDRLDKSNKENRGVVPQYGDFHHEEYNQATNST